MNDFQKAINDLQCVKKLAKLPKYGVTAIETAISAIQELEQYREIGTLEEFRGAMKRQQALPPRKALLFEGKQAETAKSNGIKNFDTYRCPECGRIVAERTVVRSVYPDGFIKYKYCKDCGQKLDWGDKYD